ncbi:glycine/D-amino acid oxidase-like deaminating enzyme [Micromonospora pisi]|uniref:Glycine/D-amino acid oxidase-like deaminating enzyme n=1 Tax=Micromonospora pisi TaxID=589240 RepID=A0A495JRE2_9ACTN|nr:FAD-binding oxidoreductase [Micromonospora pisi]RKR91088.1 glycine/D-amino acid oxidase-like deaminating enzyme [Micromonospora pisi]
MVDTVEVAVVGAGMFGSAAAKYLSRAGFEVLVIGPAEPAPGAASDRYAFGAHFDAARITRRLGWDEVWGATDSRSQERFRSIEDESGVPFFHDCGSLILMAKSIGHRTDAIVHQSAAKHINVDRLTADELRDHLPDLGLPPLEGGVEGLLERRDAGYLNPRRLVQAQLTLAARAGGRLRRAAVVGMRKDTATGMWHLDVRGDGGPGVVRARKVVVATGAFTNHNGALPPGRRLALRAFSEPNLLFEVTGELLERLRRLPTIVTVDPVDNGDANLTLYLLPPVRYPDGRWYLRVGPGMQPMVHELHTVEDMVAWYAGQRVTSEQHKILSAMMHMLVPSLEPVSVRQACCIIEKTPSRYPYIGHLDGDESITVAVGGNGHGARGSDEIGRLAANLVIGKPWDFPIPQDVFKPLLEHPHEGEGRPDFLRPPFGLC